MPIKLTCICGRQLIVANESAGLKIICSGCGKAFSVPALGVLMPAKSKARPAAPPSATASSNQIRTALIVAASAILMVGGLGGMAWYLSIPAVEDSKQVAVAQPTEKPETPVRITQPAPVRIDTVTPVQGGGPVVTPMLTVSDPVKPVKPRVVEPVKPLVDETPNPVIVEPAKQTLDPPKEKPKEKEPLPTVAKKLPNVMEPLKLIWRLQEEDKFYGIGCNAEADFPHPGCGGRVAAAISCRARSRCGRRTMMARSSSSRKSSCQDAADRTAASRRHSAVRSCKCPARPTPCT